MAAVRGVELTGLTIGTERLQLRPWRPADAAALVAALGSGPITAYLPLPDPYTLADARDFIAGPAGLERASGTGVDCAVVERATGALVGSASLRLPDGRREADIGYWIAASAQRRGYATEATRGLADWAFAHDVHRLELRIDTANAASAGVALRAGFAFESVRRDGLRSHGEWRDLAVFARTSDDPGEVIAPAFPALPGGRLADGVLALRAMQPDDLVAFAEQERDPLTVAVGLTGEAPPEAAMRRLLNRGALSLLVGPVAAFTILDLATGRYAGAVQLRAVGPRQVGGLGYAVHPEFRGRGYTARALRLLSAWALGPAGFHRLEIGAKRENVASQRAAVSGGFEPDGVLAGRLRNPDGTFSDEVRFCLVGPTDGPIGS